MDVPFIDGVTWEPQRRHNSLLDQVVKYLWASNCFTGSSLGGFDLSWGMVCITHLKLLYNTLTEIANFWPKTRMHFFRFRKSNHYSKYHFKVFFFTANAWNWPENTYTTTHNDTTEKNTQKASLSASKKSSQNDLNSRSI